MEVPYYRNWGCYRNRRIQSIRLLQENPVRLFQSQDERNHCCMKNIYVDKLNNSLTPGWNPDQNKLTDCQS